MATMGYTEPEWELKEYEKRWQERVRMEQQRGDV